MKASHLSLLLAVISIAISVAGLNLNIHPTAWYILAGVLAVSWLALCNYIRFRKGRLDVTAGFWGVMAKMASFVTGAGASPNKYRAEFPYPGRIRCMRPATFGGESERIPCVIGIHSARYGHTATPVDVRTCKRS